jgi:hypothetical protein
VASATLKRTSGSWNNWASWSQATKETSTENGESGDGEEEALTQELHEVIELSDGEDWALATRDVVPEMINLSDDDEGLAKEVIVLE